jgi:glycosyltransferase involved in cell wall biosynthesis
MRVAVMTPTYNECENISAFLEHVRNAVPDADVFVVDDASPDGTAARVVDHAAQDSRIHLISRQGPRGYAAASREGLARIIDDDYDAIVTIDCDLSHDPAVIPAMLTSLASDADLVIGSRYVAGGGIRNWSLFRRMLSRYGNWYAGLILGVGVRDCTSGFRAYRGSLVRSGVLSATSSEGYAFLTESLFRIREAQQWTIAEVPITYIERTAGRSKMSRAIIAESVLRVTALGVQRIFGRRAS